MGLDGGLQYEDIKGSHVVIHSQYFNGVSWRATVVNQIHMESGLKTAFELPHHTRSKGELYLSDCKWLHFHCVFYPAPPSPLIPHCIFKHVPYSCARCMCVSIYVRMGEEGVKYCIYNAYVSCILTSRPLNSNKVFWWSFSVCHSVFLDKSDILFLCLPTTSSEVITVCMGRICLCK